MSELTADKLAKAYIKIRDKRRELEQQFKEKDDALKVQMETIEAELLEICKRTGAETLRTSAGTVIKGSRKRYWTSDWSAMYGLIEQHNVPFLLEKRIHQGEMAQWLEDNPELLPPGLNSDNKATITVRRR